MPAKQWFYSIVNVTVVEVWWKISNVASAGSHKLANISICSCRHGSAQIFPKTRWRKKHCFNMMVISIWPLPVYSSFSKKIVHQILLLVLCRSWTHSICSKIGLHSVCLPPSCGFCPDFLKYLFPRKNLSLLFFGNILFFLNIRYIVFP